MNLASNWFSQYEVYYMYCPMLVKPWTGTIDCSTIYMVIEAPLQNILGQVK